ncbi:serine protease inhibitor 2 [Plakobranchus ocellatus]|uniref:Serine protease inhibitor 2 n=1 Tax=Plakobranchus ocellatus TaxID=259542 RepID=A0AAV4CAU1_9GAST|nr:serine protease inhibitor 2 [Plakobranchus ocellatus]
MCLAYFPRYYYSRQNESCEFFVCGGCGGNGNNFRSREECDFKCHDCLLQQINQVILKIVKLRDKKVQEEATTGQAAGLLHGYALSAICRKTKEVIINTTTRPNDTHPFEVDMKTCTRLKKNVKKRVKVDPNQQMSNEENKMLSRLALFV